MSTTARRIRTAVRCLFGLFVVMIPVGLALLVQVIGGPDPAMLGH